MPLDKEHSLVAESTLSTSPASSVIKRAPRTYGRRRDPVVQDPDSSIISSSSVSRGSIFRTGPPDLDEEIPPSSEPSRSLPDSDCADDEEETNDPQDALPSFEFGWKARLKELDEQEDLDIEIPHVSGSEHASNPPPIPRVVEPRTMPNSPADKNIAPSAAGLFNGSLPTLTDSSFPPSSFEEPASPTSPVKSRKGRHLKKHAIVHDSDSESEFATQTTVKSPVNPHPITTPRLQSSPTPPTSEDDTPIHPTSLSRSKGKGKAKFAFSPGEPSSLNYDDDELIAPKRTKTMLKDKRKKSKVKAPTKKELAETARDRLRIAADQQISVPRAQNNSHKFTLQNLFASVGQTTISTVPSSDPIVQFSSPSAIGGLTKSKPVIIQTALKGPVAKPRSRTSAKLNDDNIPALDSDSEDLPELGAIIYDEQEKKRAADRQRELLETKKRVLALQAAVPNVDDDDDDDLEVVFLQDKMQVAVKDEDEVRKSGKKKRYSEIRKRQLNLGGVGFSRQQKQSPGKNRDVEVPSFLSPSGKSRGKERKDKGLMSQGELNKVLAKRVLEENKEATKKKEEEWVRRGGKIALGSVEGEKDAPVDDIWKVYAEKGLNAAANQGNEDDIDDEEEEQESDEDWTPELRGSASPPPNADDHNEPGDASEEDVTMVNEADPDPEAEEEMSFSRRPRHSLAVLNSDSEEDENNENAQPIKQPSFHPRVPSRLFEQEGISKSAMLPPAYIPTMARSSSLYSSEEPTEDEGDKENNTTLMFDRSDDKENKAVVRHIDGVGRSPLKSSSLFGLDDVRRDASMSPGAMMMGSRDTEGKNNNKRRPFDDLLADEDPFVSQAGPSQLSPFAMKLRQSSPSTTLTPSALQLTLQPMLVPDDKGLSFSQFPDDDDEPTEFGGLAQPNFSDLFDAATEKQKSQGRAQPKSIFDKLRQAEPSNSLDLTQDVALQPAFQVGENILRKADLIFEKEQAYLLEAANKKPQKKVDLYVNEVGFLTQTRPDVSSPDVYRPPSESQPFNVYGTQRDLAATTPLSERPPLRTLSLADSVDFDTAEPTPLRRLTKRFSSPSASAVKSHTSPSLSPSSRSRPANAFDVLTAAKEKRKSEKVKARLKKSEFVEAEAQESDDDEMLGFGFKKNEDGEEEEGEDLDKNLEALVDDQVMDEDTVAAQLVLEKYKEQEEEADRQNEKLHQAAIHGELRKKKRNHGVGMDDSDDDSDEDETNRRIRRGMHKKQKIDRGDIMALGNDEKTLPFFNLYQQDLVDNDSAELAYLQAPTDVVMTNTEAEEEEPREYVSREEIERRVREVAVRGEQDSDNEPLNPHDVSWIDNDVSDDNDEIRVKTIATAPRKARGGRPQVLDLAEFDDGEARKAAATEKQPERKKMELWAKVEGRSRNAGTSRSVGGAAVTGHSKSKLKTGNGSMRNAQLESASSSSTRRPEARRLKTAPSMLAGVADRSARFEQC